MIFVCGTPRSGTTLTAAILDRHPSLLGGGELHFYDHFSTQAFCDPQTRAEDIENLLKLYAQFSQFDDQERVNAHRMELENALFSVATPGQALNVFMQVQADLLNKDDWVNSTPRDIFQTDRIFSDFPNSKLIICLRDPYDFIASYKNRYKTTYASNKDRLKNIYHPVTAAALWYATIRRAMSVASKHPANTFILKYENLVNDSDEILRKLCDFLEVEYDNEMTHVTSENSSYSKGTTKGIFSSSVNQGASRLSGVELAIVDFFKSFYAAHFFGYGKRLRLSSVLILIWMAPSTILQILNLVKWSHRNGRNESFIRYIARRFKK